MEVKHNCSICIHRKDVFVPCDWLKAQNKIVLKCPYFEREGAERWQMKSG